MMETVIQIVWLFMFLIPSMGLVLGILPLLNCVIRFRKGRRFLMMNSDTLKNYISEENAEPIELFHFGKLKTQFMAYRKARISAATVKNASPYCDIAEYFNVGFINDIAFSGICELIPGAMTGLGILGTFLGLRYAVKDLSVENSEVLTHGITNLLGGMSTAFETSIWGVILSLLFSFVYKFFYRWAIDEMNLFVDYFRNQNLDGHNEQPTNQILGFQKAQTEAMQGMAKVLAQELANSIAETLTPITSKMEQTIDEFARFASMQQQEGLEKIVGEFIEAMHNALNGQFEELGRTIEKLCVYQKENTERMQKIVDEVCETSTDIERVNALQQKTIAEMNDFVEKTHIMQEEIRVQVEYLERANENGVTIQEKTAAYIEQLVGYEARIAALSDSARSQVEVAQQTVKELSEVCAAEIEKVDMVASEQIGLLADAAKQTNTILSETSHQQIQSITETAKEGMELLSSTSTQLAEASHAQMETLAEVSAKQAETAQQTVKELSEVCAAEIEKVDMVASEQIGLLADTAKYANKVLSETSYQQIQAVAETAKGEMQLLSSTSTQLAEENHAQLEQLAETSSKQMESLTSTANEALKNGQQQIAASVAAAQEQSDNFMRATNRYAEFVQRQMKNMTDAVHKEIGEIATFADKTSQGLEKSTASMEKAVDTLDHSLNSALGHTFESFDSGLAQIAQHLSGTLVDIRETTEALPHIMASAQKRYEESLKKVIENTEKYAQTMHDLAKELQQTTSATVEGDQQ